MITQYEQTNICRLSDWCGGLLDCRFTTETRAESKAPDVARMLEVTRVPGVAGAGIKEARPFQLFAGVERIGGPAITARTRFPAASLSKPVFAWAVYNLKKQGKLDWTPENQKLAALGHDSQGAFARTIARVLRTAQLRDVAKRATLILHRLRTNRSSQRINRTNSLSCR